MTKLLIVDDEELIRTRLQKLLDMDGYETRIAENGIRGLEIFKEFSPDIVLLDIKMPGMDGIQVLDEIKKSKTYAEVFVMTGHGGLETAIQSLRKGAFDYLTKPIDYDELEINIKRAVEKQSLQLRLDSYVHDLEAAHRKLQIQQAQLLQAAKLTAVGELGAGVAHEMNQPLMAISSHLEILLLNPVISEDQKIKDKILKIRDQFTRLGTIVKRMHEYSSGRTGTYADESIHRPVSDAYYLFSQQLKDHNIQISLELVENTPKLFIDRYQIQDVAINFLVNARDAIDDAFGQKEGGSIRIISKIFEAQQCVLIGLIDNGIPIKDGTETELFNPFFTTKPVGKGTGLGLSVCYNIIKNHNGLLSFAKLKDGRKMFYFILPVDKNRNLAGEANLINEVNQELAISY